VRRRCCTFDTLARLPYLLKRLISGCADDRVLCVGAPQVIAQNSARYAVAARWQTMDDSPVWLLVAISDDLSRPSLARTATAHLSHCGGGGVIRVTNTSGGMAVSDRLLSTKRPVVVIKPALSAESHHESDLGSAEYLPEHRARHGVALDSTMTRGAQRRDVRVAIAHGEAEPAPGGPALGDKVVPSEPIDPGRATGFQAHSAPSLFRDLRAATGPVDEQAGVHPAKDHDATRSSFWRCLAAILSARSIIPSHAASGIQ
jgi:hypothetical protein